MSEAAAESVTTTGPEITDPGPGVSASNPAPVTPSKTTSQAERMAKALSRLNGTPAPAAEPAPEPAKLEGAKPTEEPAAPAAEPPKADPVDAKAEARLARALADAQKLEAAKLQLERERKADLEARQKLEADSAKRIADLEAKLKQFDELDPVSLLSKRGLSVDELNKKLINGEIQAPTDVDLLKKQFAEESSSLKNEIQQLRAEREAEKAAAAEAAKNAETAATRARDLDTVKNYLKSSEKDYPIAAAIADPEHVLTVCYENGIADPSKVLEHIENTSRQQVEALWSNPALVQAFLKNPKIRETVKTAIGSDQSRKTTNSSDGPRALAADVVSAPTTPKDPAKPKNRDERMKNALAKLGMAG